jgi:penicillin-insensitive murein endopeptidase
MRDGRPVDAKPLDAALELDDEALLVDQPTDLQAAEPDEPDEPDEQEEQWEAPGPSVPQSAESSFDAPPDADTLRRLVATDRGALGSLSLGTPDAGALLGSVQMTEGRLWTIRNPAEAWGTEETLGFIKAAVETVEARRPGSPPLLIGDISAPQGGPLNRHKSHQAGRDVDLGWYFLDGESSELRAGTDSNLDLARNWALLRALATETDVERVFVDRSVQRRLHQYALESGEDPTWLEEIFQCARGRRSALVQHVRRHKTHLHVRFHNRRAQEWGRAAYPLLAEVGLAPPPVVMHRVRQGETLSGIARRYGARVSAIRAANNLRSTRIRAGRRYRIPVRLAAAAVQPPIVVPARRLPPPPEQLIAGAPGDTVEAETPAAVPEAAGTGS